MPVGGKCGPQRCPRSGDAFHQTLLTIRNYTEPIYKISKSTSNPCFYHFCTRNVQVTLQESILRWFLKYTSMIPQVYFHDSSSIVLFPKYTCTLSNSPDHRNGEGKTKKLPKSIEKLQISGFIHSGLHIRMFLDADFFLGLLKLSCRAENSMIENAF